MAEWLLCVRCLLGSTEVWLMVPHSAVMKLMPGLWSPTGSSGERPPSKLTHVVLVRFSFLWIAVLSALCSHWLLIRGLPPFLWLPHRELITCQLASLEWVSKWKETEEGERESETERARQRQREREKERSSPTTWSQKPHSITLAVVSLLRASFQVPPTVKRRKYTRLCVQTRRQELWRPFVGLLAPVLSASVFRALRWWWVCWIHQMQRVARWKCFYTFKMLWNVKRGL